MGKGYPGVDGQPAKEAVVIFAETAPRYHAAGLYVIPLLGKKPYVPAWAKYCETRVDPATLAEWIAKYPCANIGLPLGRASGLCALDVDGLDVATAHKALITLKMATPWLRVGAKGFVALYRWHEGLKSFQIKAPDGSVLVELLGPGRQVVLPPSIHPDTRKPYTANCDLLDVLADLPGVPRGS